MVSNASWMVSFLHPAFRFDDLSKNCIKTWYCSEAASETYFRGKKVYGHLRSKIPEKFSIIPTHSSIHIPNRFDNLSVLCKSCKILATITK